MPLFGDTSDWDTAYLFAAAYMFCGSGFLVSGDTLTAELWIARGWFYWGHRRAKVCDG